MILSAGLLYICTLNRYLELIYLEKLTSQSQYKVWEKLNKNQKAVIHANICQWANSPPSNLYCKLWFDLILTWPEVKPIKAVGAEVVSHSVAPPAFTSCGPRLVALSGSPANTQVCGLRCEEGVDVIHNQLVVPPAMLGWVFPHSQEDVWPHAEVEECEEQIKIANKRQWWIVVPFFHLICER